MLARKAEDEDIAEVSDTSVVVVKPKCNHCDKLFSSEEELKAHSESAHDANLTSLPSPEKGPIFLAGATCCELQASPIQQAKLLLV